MTVTRIRSAVLVLFIAAAVALTTGCGAGHSSVNPALAAADEGQQAAAAAIAAGAIATAGENQLFAGGSVAWLDHPRGDLRGDARDPLDAILRDAGNEPPSPTIGSGVITNASSSFPLTTANLPQVVQSNSQLTYTIDTAGLPANWYHVALTIPGGQQWKIVSENGNTTIFTSGQMDMFISDTVSSDDHAGNWTHAIQSYAIIGSATTACMTGAVTIADGTVRPTTLYGLRHESHTVQRAIANGIVTRTDSVIVDGDFSGMPAGTTPASPGNGPNPANTNPPQIFSLWVQPCTTPTGYHTFLWSRLCNYTEVYSYAAGAATPGPGQVPFHAEDVFITKDTYTPYGPLTDYALINTFRMTYDLGRAAQFY
jgi:hypothetical protein